MESRSLAEEARAEIGIEGPEELLNILFGALQPEAERPSSPRSEVSIEVSGGSLRVRVRADDISALRAALNSYLRWAGAILDVVDTVRIDGSPRQ